MIDRRCGTCRHFTPGDGYSGHCGIGAFLGRATAFSGETGCPGWSSGDDYARGWRDAMAYAGELLLFALSDKPTAQAIAETLSTCSPQEPPQ